MFVRFGIPLVVLAVAMAQPARAEETRQQLEDRIQRLERIIEQQGLDKEQPSQIGSPDDPIIPRSEVDALVDEKIKKQKVLAGWQDGFFLQSPSGDFKLKIRGWAQADARFFPIENGDTGTDTFTLRRVRPIFEGNVFKYVDYRIMLDFGGGSSTLQDGWVRLNYWPQAQVTVGKMKSPLSLERLQSGRELTFVERSIANNLAPNRDVGVTLGGLVFGERLGYQLGVFNGAPDNGNTDTDATSDKDFAGRVFAEPFKGTSAPSGLRGIGFGIAGTYGTAKRESYNNLAYNTGGRARFFRLISSSTTNVYFDGTRGRIAPQAYWYWGPLGVMGEYIQDSTDLLQEVTNGGVTTRADSTLETHGWFAQASYVLTGEAASYKEIIPINPFDPRNGRWGAFELAGRVSQIDIDENVFRDGFASVANGATSGATAFTGGINWYLNRNFKIQFNWEHTEFDDDLAFSGKDRSHEDVAVTRFQVSY
jgi:phosphate-selective porin OprO/OprP